ncbi:hypothetical protein AAFC00_002161 [Neodothiora populina]|uniref:DNA ligase D 3'-phosphoesterase domain-containing protein n=1 Tax=Neodothiora populina TaxID=2781224 RepID=A0ABR3PGH2_9PEZI
MRTPDTLQRSISPPQIRMVARSIAIRNQDERDETATVSPDEPQPTLAAIEAGEVQIRDHLAYFAAHLKAACRMPVPNSPRLSIDEWKGLYTRNQHRHGRHFVVHQHDHPISGVHYDLRLQFSSDSSISFAIPYGLPGNPNSTRPMRMAIETRVHCLWNHLIESASHATGPLLIWDTGEYEIIEPQKAKAVQPETDSDDSSDPEQANNGTRLTDSEKLNIAFGRRHIRLRLHGTRLPQGYTVALRLPSANDTSGDLPKKPKFRPRKRTKSHASRTLTVETTDSDSEMLHKSDDRRSSQDINKETLGSDEAALAFDDDAEDDLIRANNAYPGATNTIGSIHQRRWFLSLDKEHSGFVRSVRTGRWTHSSITVDSVSQKDSGQQTFFVLGRDHERSVVTGRLAMEVMEDQGVTMYKGRKMWRAITE